MESSKNIQVSTGHDGKLTLTLNGDLTIRNASAIKSAFLEGIERSSEITIDLVQVTALDLSIIQLLYAIRKSSAKAIMVNATLSKNLYELVCYSGLGAVFNNLNSVL